MPSNQPRTVYAPEYTGPRLFGAPVGDFSLLQTMLMTVAVSVASFFAATFCAIMVMLAMLAMHAKPDFSIAYKYVGLPVGIGMFVLAGGYLGSLLVMRLRRKG